MQPDSDKLRLLMDATQIGWCESDFDARTHCFSDYFVGLFGLEGDSVSFSDFGRMVREDYRTRIISEFRSIPHKGRFDQTFPVLAGKQTIWVRTNMALCETDHRGHVIATGMMQVVDNPEKKSASAKTVQRINNLLYQQNSIFTSLVSFLKQGDISETIESTFRDILGQFGGERAYLFEYDWENRIQDCSFAVSHTGRPSVQGDFRQMPMDQTPWWTERMRSGRPIILDRLDALPSAARAERQLLESMDVRSMIATPMMNRDGCWGFIGIDVVDGYRHWSDEDYQWFSSVSNVLGVCYQLRNSEARSRRDSLNLQHLYQHMPVGYLRCRILFEDGVPADFVITEGNPGADNLLGIPVGSLLNRRISELDGELGRSVSVLGEVVNTDEYKVINYYWELRNRHLRCVFYSPLPDEVVVLFSDTTESVLAHRALVEKEALLRNIYQNLPVGLELYDKDGMLIDINDRELEILGLEKKEDAIGIDLFKNPVVSDEYMEMVRRHEDVNLSLRYDYSRIKGYLPSRKTGTGPMIVKLTSLYDTEGNFSNYLVINVDNTETTNAYDKISEFEDLFSLVGKFAKVGYAHFNALTRDGYALDSWYENVGEVPGTPLPQIIRVHDRFHPEDREVMLNFFGQVLAGESDHLRLDARILRSDGRYSWTRINVIVRNFHPEENNIEMICVNYDITALKETEEALIIARDKAETSDRLKSAFLANMSHEIRTPLNAIVGFSSLLADAEDPAEKQMHSSIIRENNELLLQLISDILDLSKIEAGTFDFTEGPVDVRELCQETVRAMQMKVQPGVVLTFDEQSPRVRLLGDKTRITQVISNFITNALKFTSEGSVAVSYAVTDGNYVRFAVRDTGIGIPQEKSDAVFDRFVKLNTFAQGTGLGLSICKNLVGQMGGQIGVESEVGKGSCFWFTHPYDPGSDTADAAKEDTGVGLFAESVSPVSTCGDDERKLILVAEDIDSNFMLVQALLRKHYRLVRAMDGVEALEMFRELHPDLILMDMKMPRMDGLEATRKIREIDSSVPVIAVTAFAFDKDRQKAVDAGCNDYVSKPLAGPELLRVIRHWI